MTGDTLTVVEIAESRATTNDSVYPWDEDETEAKCAVLIQGARYDLYVGMLPNNESAWYVRQKGRRIAVGIGDGMACAIARAESAAEAWAEADTGFRIYDGYANAH